MSVDSASERNVLLRRLADALEHLSWPAERQRSYLQELGTSPSLDELALEFDDALRTVAGVFTDPSIDAETQRMLSSIDVSLTVMSNRSDEPDRWDVRSLDENPRWVEIRKLAASVCRRLPRAFQDDR